MTLGEKVDSMLFLLLTFSQFLVKGRDRTGRIWADLEGMPGWLEGSETCGYSPLGKLRQSSILCLMR